MSHIINKLFLINPQKRGIDALDGVFYDIVLVVWVVCSLLNYIYYTVWWFLLLHFILNGYVLGRALCALLHLFCITECDKTGNSYWMMCLVNIFTALPAFFQTFIIIAQGVYYHV